MGSNNKRSVKLDGGLLVPIGSIGNKKYYQVNANNPNKTDSVIIGNKLAVDNGEVVEVNNNTVRVISADLGTTNLMANLMKNNPINKAFNMAFKTQEKFKDKIGLNDDGTMKANKGGNIRLNLLTRRGIGLGSSSFINLVNKTASNHITDFTKSPFIPIKAQTGTKVKLQPGGEVIDESNVLAPAIVIDKATTRKGRFKAAKENIHNLQKDTNFLLDAINKLYDKNGFISTPEAYNTAMDLSLYARDYNDVTKEYRDAKYDYYGNLFGKNSIFAQLYRYKQRHKNKNKNKNISEQEQTSTRGADIIDLSKNVVRLTPNSNQKTALFNEFVENKYPTVKPASWYSKHKNSRIIDSNVAKVSDMNVFAGIEDGKFKIDSLYNFNPNTTIIPARNIKKGIPTIQKLVIEDNNHGNNNDYSSITQSIRYNINNSVYNKKFRWEDYLNMSNEDKQYIKDLVSGNIEGITFNNIYKKILEYIDKTGDIYGDNPEYNKLFNEDSNTFIYALEANIDSNLRFNEKNHKNPSIGIDDSIAQLNSKNNEFYNYGHNRFINQYSKNSKSKGYYFIGRDGKQYPISDYNASVLDGKTVLANPNGGLFIGRLQDISNEQLNKVNAYLKNNPSWLMRTDLGSFDQYRLDSPTLYDYLKQYFEHPKATDPNVYVVGTTEDNKFNKGGKTKFTTKNNKNMLGKVKNDLFNASKGNLVRAALGTKITDTNLDISSIILKKMQDELNTGNKAYSLNNSNLAGTHNYNQPNNRSKLNLFNGARFRNFFNGVGNWFTKPQNQLIVGSIADAGLATAEGISSINAINKLQAPQMPSFLSIPSLLTTYNINGSKSALSNEYGIGKNIIDLNTASSAVKQARIRNLANKVRETRLQLEEQKNNQETNLINQNKVLQAQIAIRNNDSYNQYLNNKTAFENQKLLERAQAVSGTLNSMGNIIGGLIGGLNSLGTTNTMYPNGVVPLNLANAYNKVNNGVNPIQSYMNGSKLFGFRCGGKKKTNRR